MGRISPSDRDRAASQFNQSVDLAFHRLTVATEHFARAAEMVALSDAGLRAGDALHLAVAESAEATICTLDTRMAIAARSFGLTIEVPHA
jgi:predicted nucleic acid-binding protein